MEKKIKPVKCILICRIIARNSHKTGPIRFVFNILCSPHSSASIERLFSQINLNNTTTRISLKKLEKLNSYEEINHKMLNPFSGIFQILVGQPKLTRVYLEL